MTTRDYTRILVRVVILVLIWGGIALVRGTTQRNLQADIDDAQEWLYVYDWQDWACREVPGQIGEAQYIEIECSAYYDVTDTVDSQYAETRGILLHPVSRISKHEGDWGYYSGQQSMIIRGREVEGGYDILYGGTRGSGFLAPVEGQNELWLGHLDLPDDGRVRFCLSSERFRCYYLLRFGESALR